MEEPAAKRGRVHFGSLEEQEKKRLQQNGEQKSSISPAILAGIKAGNINIASRGAHYIEMPFLFLFFLMGRPSQ